MNHDHVIAHRADHWDAVHVGHDENGVSWFSQRLTTTLSLLDAAGVELVARGHIDVTALDVSGSGLAVARDRLIGAGDPVSWWVADLLEWKPDRRFDVWHDRAVFHFLPTRPTRPDTGHSSTPPCRMTASS